MLTTAFNHNGPASVRYPRGTGPNTKVEKKLADVKIGEARVIREANKNNIMLNFGSLLHIAEEVSHSLELTLIDMRFVKPLDEKILLKYLQSADVFISIEDGSVMGGAGSAVQEFCSENGISIKSLLCGIPDRFIEHASRDEMLEEAGLSPEQIKSKIKELIQYKTE